MDRSYSRDLGHSGSYHGPVEGSCGRGSTISSQKAVLLPRVRDQWLRGINRLAAILISALKLVVL
jgi:hypothetical protein